jgi:predicted permease
MRADVTSALKQSSRQGNVQGRQRLRGTLVVLEASSAVVLLIVAGLLVHSLVEVLRVPTGFSPDGVLIARTTFNRQRYPAGEGRREAERQIIERLRALPNVTAVGLTTHIPLPDERQIGFILDGEDIRSVRWANNALVSGEYFTALGIPLLRGRTFGHEDAPEAPPSAIVNDSMARHYWPQGDALGKRLVWGERKLTIVGIAGDVHIEGIDAQINPTIYPSVFQIESGATTNAVFVVRGRAADQAALAPAVRDAVWSVDQGVPVFDTRTMDEIVSRSLETRRFAVTMLSCFAILALALAVIGLYGVLSYAVTQRTSELGVRFAMGATGQVLQLVVSHGLRLTMTGILIGVSFGAVAARGISHLLYRVSVNDPATFLGAASLLMLIAAVASYLPARRASRLDPVTALRFE